MHYKPRLVFYIGMHYIAYPYRGAFHAYATEYSQPKTPEARTQDGSLNCIIINL